MTGVDALPANLPVPADDGACAGLVGSEVAADVRGRNAEDVLRWLEKE